MSQDDFEDVHDDELEDDDGGYVGQDVDEEDVAEYFGDKEQADWIAALRRDPVKRARKVVRTIRASGQRKEALSKAIATGNNMKLFTEAGTHHDVKDLQVIKDVQHHWDSLYLMLDRLFHLKQVLKFYFPILPQLTKFRDRSRFDIFSKLSQNSNRWNSMMATGMYSMA